MQKRRKKNIHSTKKQKEIANEIMSHDLDLEFADELLVHDEFIPEYFSWTDEDMVRLRVDEIEKLTESED